MTPALLQPLVRGVLRSAARHYRSKPFVMRNSAPLVSFTFDDVPDSAYTNGASILEQHGLRGTFYVASGILGSIDTHWRLINRDQVRALHGRGHEIGCHTFSHVRVDRLDADGMAQECRSNCAALRELTEGVEATNFCYPFGRASLPRKRELERRYDTCRGIYEGINAGTVDLAMLRVIELYDRTLTRDKLRRVLRETRERNGWLIFYTHDVTDEPSWIGCSPRLLRTAIEAVQAENMRCLTIHDALAAIGFPRRSNTAFALSAAAATASP
jgi:peptidoglycan/xylan/chitin deacetylase (PgdA/CDA1 family)